MQKRSFLHLLLLLFILILAACEDQPEQDLLPTVAGEEPQAVAVNPPRVWIDSPLADTALIFDGVPLPIIAHASFLSGDAILRVSDAAGATLETVALEQIEQVRAGSGLLTRHEGLWLPTPQEAPNVAPDGSVIYRLTVELGGLSSEPVILRLYMPTPTPSTTPTFTLTPTITSSPTVTASDTPTATLTASPTATASPTVTGSATFTPTPSASATRTASPTLTATSTATATITSTPTPTQDATDMPEIVFVDKVPGPCEFTPIRGAEVAARVGPGENRAARLFLDFGETYSATGYNDDLGIIWWLGSIENQALWVDSNLVIETGACGALAYVEAPPIVYRPPDDTTTDSGGDDGVTPVPGQPVIYYFTATPLNPNFCTTLSWSVEFVDAVYLDGQGVVGMDSREVCLPAATSGVSRTFTLVIYKNGVAVDQRSVTVSSTGQQPPPPPQNQPPVFAAFAATGCESTGVEFPVVYFTVSDPEGNPLRVSSAYSSNTNYVRITTPGTIDANGRGRVGFSCVFDYGDGFVSVNIIVTVTDGTNYVARTATIRAPDGVIQLR